MLAISALAALIAALSFTLLQPMTAVVSCALGWAMLAIAVSDVRRFLVPDVLSLPAVPAGLLVSGWLAPQAIAAEVVIWHTAAAALGALGLYTVGALYERLRKRQGLGLGDVKLAAGAGAWTGPDGMTLVLLLACAAALTYVLALRLRGDETLSGTTAIPLGTFLAPSIWCIWLFGQALAH